MNIDVAFSAAPLDDIQLRDRNVVVIDVLRASTTIVTALANGAREIIPVASIESAVKISGSLFGEVTLRGGERNGRRIEGFNLGNSPAEYDPATVSGKSIIFCTTNGSVAMAKSRYARRLIVGGFANLTTVVSYIAKESKDFLLLCAGKWNGVRSFSMEDSVCAGMIINQLMKRSELEVSLTDSSAAALALYKANARSIPKLLRTCDHGAYLAEIGFGSDLKLCSTIDAFDVLPIQVGTVIKKFAGVHPPAAPDEGSNDG